MRRLPILNALTDEKECTWTLTMLRDPREHINRCRLTTKKRSTT